jgi:chromosome segregation ATPase
MEYEKLKERREKWKARALEAEDERDHLKAEIDYFKATNNDLAMLVTDLREDVASLLRLVAQIRAAAGDPHGKLMQPELITHIAALNAHHIPDARKMVSGPNSTACDDQYQAQPEAGR